MIAVIVPAHNEEEHMARCLQSLAVAAACPALGGKPVVVIVVLDDCSDGTGAIARDFAQVRCLESRARHVGTARAVDAVRTHFQALYQDRDGHRHTARVTTSARKRFGAPGRFGATLMQWGGAMVAVPAS